MNDTAMCALVLAAGKGTRMHARDLPKVMMPVLGEPMLWYVLRALTPVFDSRVHTVVGFGGDHVRKAFPEYQERFVEQEEQLGTGHALKVAWPRLKEAGYRWVVVVNGDTPLLSSPSVSLLVKTAREQKAALAFLSVEAPEPNAFGRVLRDEDGRVAAIRITSYNVCYTKLLRGPISQVGAGIGSWLSDKLGLSTRERRILLLAGAAGGLGAIFRAPLGGALTAIEVIYREDFEAEAVLPAVLSSVVAYSIFALIFGTDPILA